MNFLEARRFLSCFAHPTPVGKRHQQEGGAVTTHSPDPHEPPHPDLEHPIVPELHASRTVTDMVSGSLADRLVVFNALVASFIRDGERLADEASGAELGDAARLVHHGTQVLQAHRLAWILRERESSSWHPPGLVGNSYATHLANSHGITRSAALADIRLAEKLRDFLPATRAAVQSGQLGLTQARILQTAATTPARQEALRMQIVPGDDPVKPMRNCTMEELLIERAQEFKPEQFGVMVRHFNHLADLEATERGEAAIDAKQFFEVSRTMDGFHVAGFLNEENGKLLTEALRAVCGPPAMGDQRSADQRRADGIGEIARRLLDAGTLGVKQKAYPHLSVLIPWPEFQRIVGPLIPDARHELPLDADTGSAPAGGSADPRNMDWLSLLDSGAATWEDGTGPVPDHLIRKIAVTGKICRVIFGPDSQVINLGRDARLFSHAQVRAMTARDRGCVWPACGAPTFMTDAHHTIKWERGGPTDLRLGAPLCRSHHATVDNHSIVMTWNKTWRFFYPDGREITDRPTPWINRS